MEKRRPDFNSKGTGGKGGVSLELEKLIPPQE
jgi:hypothetical protein